MNSTARPLLIGSVGLLLLGMPASSSDATDWDQAKVTAIAEQLVDSGNDVYRSVLRTDSSMQAGSGQSRHYLELKDKVRIARNESRHLARELQNGKGKDETFHAWQRLMSVVRDARDIARRMFLESPTQDKMARANNLIDQLAPFYQKAAD